MASLEAEVEGLQSKAARSTRTCDRIRNGTEELTDAEAIRFLTAVRTGFLGGGEPA